MSLFITIAFILGMIFSFFVVPVIILQMGVNKAVRLQRKVSRYLLVAITCLVAFLVGQVGFLGTFATCAYISPHSFMYFNDNLLFSNGYESEEQIFNEHPDLNHRLHIFFKTAENDDSTTEGSFSGIN